VEDYVAFFHQYFGSPITLFSPLLRRSLLHFTVFKQTACHLANEANVEQVFSRARLLADPNLLPAHLSTLIMVGVNKYALKPLLAAIKDKYQCITRCSATRRLKAPRTPTRKRSARGREASSSSPHNHSGIDEISSALVSDSVYYYLLVHNKKLSAP
jgi:hypothetical protein